MFPRKWKNEREVRFRATRAHVFTLARSSHLFLFSYGFISLFATIRRWKVTSRIPSDSIVFRQRNPRGKDAREEARSGGSCGARVSATHIYVHIYIIYCISNGRTTTSHYMRHWNLYIMNELKEENLLNNYLEVINPRTFRRSCKTGQSDRRVDRIRIRNSHSMINVIIEYNNNFKIQSREDQSAKRNIKSSDLIDNNKW